LHQKKKKPVWCRNRFWVAVFIVWLAFISGIKSETPGILQAIRLKRYLSDQKNSLIALESQIASSNAEITKLRNDDAYQEAEIRRLLGYTKKGELVFEFK